MLPNIPFSMRRSIQQMKSSAIYQKREDHLVPLPAVLLTPTPVQIPDTQFAESLFTKSITAMTQSDRESAYDDIHGIPLQQTEDPALIQQSLDRLEHEIEKRADNQAYHLAKLSNPDYVQNREFRLSFLKSDRFNAEKAAFRMVRHFQIKMELFGTEKLGRDIVQDDLDENDMELLYGGNVQLLPTKDRGGRAVVLFGTYCGMPVAHETKRRSRCLFYLLMLAARDAESVVGMFCLMNSKLSEKGREVILNAAWMVPRLLIGMPIHLAAIHLGYSNSKIWSPVESVMKIASNDEYRIRFRTFQGSTKDWLVTMKGYGIQPDQVPLNDNGMMERSEYQQMLRNHRVKERSFSSYPNKETRQHIKSPGPFDVLFGKGCRYQQHEGNVKLRRLISDCRKTYEKTKRGEKYILVREIVDTVRQSTGLFLREDGAGGWIVVDNEAAEKKVGGIFRTMRSKEHLIGKFDDLSE